MLLALWILLRSYHVSRDTGSLAGVSLRDDKTGGLWESLQKDMSNIFLFLSLRKKEKKKEKSYDQNTHLLRLS